MLELVVLYGQPSDLNAFQAYYKERHLPLVNRAVGRRPLQTARFLDMRNFVTGGHVAPLAEPDGG
jgi:uncharacterized protein (TIGR02118 family)